MRTAIATVSAVAHNLKTILPELLKGHELAVNNSLMEDDSLNRQQIEMIKELPESLCKITASASKDIDMMLGQVTHEEAEPELKILSMNETLAKTLSIYPFSGNELDKVDFLTDMDFEFKGDIDFLRHILFNLIKNALYYIKASNKKGAKVDIWLEPGIKFNVLHFRDTGNGIDPEALPHIFEPLYTKRSGGTGIGLFLCKDFMQKMGGDITCESVKGEYTHFKLLFPKLEENQ